MLVYMCACRLRLCVRSGLRLRLTHHLSRPPPHHHALPVEDAAGALVISRAGLSSALFWVEAAVVPAVVLLGVPCPGGLWMFGARVFSVPASCLAGWGCCSPHTLLNIYMEEPYEHKRAHTHKCTLKHSHWYKNRCSQTHIVLICCCFKTYFVILVMCAAQ